MKQVEYYKNGNRTLRIKYEGIKKLLEKKDKEIERLNNIINEYDKYALAIAKIRDLHYSLLNDKNFRISINEILEELKGVDK